MQNQFIQQEQEINKTRNKLQLFKNNVESILKYGYNIDNLNALTIEIEKIHYPMYQMSQMADINPKIMTQVLQINDEINNYKEMLDRKRREITGKQNQQVQQQSFHLDPLDQNDEIELLKKENQKMQGQIRNLEQNQEMQNKKLQNFQNQFDMVIKQNIDLSNQVLQLNNQIIQSKCQIEEKYLQINKVHDWIQQIQQQNNLIALSDEQLQNSQIIKLMQNQFVNLNQELARISQYQSIQHSKQINF